MGNRTDQLLDLAGGGRRAAIIANAMDAAPREVRVSGVQREVDGLESLGFAADEIDLRDYFDRSDVLAAELEKYQVVWLRGGHIFMLRYALAKSGGDQILLELLREDKIVYAGYSAGPCVLSPSLTGFELVDRPDEVEMAYGEPPIWIGLGILDFTFVPHFASPGHPETEAMDNVVRYLREEHIPYRTLSDGQVMTIKGTMVTLFD